MKRSASEETFIKLSERRFLVIDVPVVADSYSEAPGYLGKGFLHAQASLVTENPVSWSKALIAAGRYAASKGRLVTPEEWQQMLSTREALSGQQRSPSST